MLLFYYCYYSFRNSSDQKHHLRVRVTPSMSLEWHLYVNDEEIGCLMDDVTNILIESQLEAALSFKNVNRIYSELLKGPPING